jgi:hypothetical protein
MLERLADNVDGLKTEIRSTRDILTGIEFRVHDLEAGADRFEAAGLRSGCASGGSHDQTMTKSVEGASTKRYFAILFARKNTAK